MDGQPSGTGRPVRDAAALEVARRLLSPTRQVSAAELELLVWSHRTAALLLPAAGGLRPLPIPAATATGNCGGSGHAGAGGRRSTEGCGSDATATVGSASRARHFVGRGNAPQADPDDGRGDERASARGAGPAASDVVETGGRFGRT